VSEIEFTLVAVVVVALFFDFTNGFHDAANAIATSVSTKALSPRVAVLLAAILNFIGAFISLEVAATVAKGIVNTDAITWNLTTWYMGFPTSSSHALIGGVLGSAIAANGFGVVLGDGVVEKVLLPSLASPILGFVLALTIGVIVFRVVARRRPGTVNRVFRRLQVLTAGFVALTHGTNDAQKTMGVIALALVATGHLPSGDDFYVPTWVILSAALAMAAGTYAGGWRIIRTLGQRVAKLEPTQGFAAEAATSAILYTTGHVGFPVSTTHTITGSVLGAGSVRRFSAVRWGLAGNIIVAWLFTIPIAASVAATLEVLTRAPGGEAIVVAIAVVAASLAYVMRTWRLRTLFAPPPPPAVSEAS
jgi:PiT family inorganic phosphate transporter